MTNDQRTQECTIEDYRKSLKDMYEHLEHREKYILSLEYKINMLRKENDKLKDLLKNFVDKIQGVL